ncbi:hypothetical protein OG21DRAFT_1487637 [Imleria badia]|nr:hypothetical protein OG21DRAFT_1487637 [Imleria badia]
MDLVSQTCDEAEDVSEDKKGQEPEVKGLLDRVQVTVIALDTDFVGLLALLTKLTTAVNDEYDIHFARQPRLQRLRIEGEVREEDDAGQGKEFEAQRKNVIDPTAVATRGGGSQETIGSRSTRHRHRGIGGDWFGDMDSDAMRGLLIRVARAGTTVSLAEETQIWNTTDVVDDDPPHVEEEVPWLSNSLLNVPVEEPSLPTAPEAEPATVPNDDIDISLHPDTPRDDHPHPLFSMGSR